MNCLLLFYSVSFRIFKITFKVNTSKEKIDFIKKTNVCNFCSMADLVREKEKEREREREREAASEGPRILHICFRSLSNISK